MVAHPGVSVKSLSKEQLKGIFTGQITNWKAVGGPDYAISVIIGKEMPGTYNVFKNRMMDDAVYTEKTVNGNNAPDVKTKVKTTPGGVGLLPVAMVDGTISIPETPNVDRPITMITKLNPPAKIKKLIEYIEGKGKPYTLPK